jgi:chromosome segregation ATPase
MSDTPRTDEISRGYLSVPVEWAKTLERELAEALEELKKANQYIATGRSWNAPDSLLAEIDTLKRELAEAREQSQTLLATLASRDTDRAYLDRQYNELRQQRDTLVEALNRIANNNVQDLPETDYAYELGRMEGIAKNALASVKG